MKTARVAVCVSIAVSGVIFLTSSCARPELTRVPHFECVYDLVNWYSRRISYVVDGPGPHDSETHTTEGRVVRRKGIHRKPDLYFCPSFQLRTRLNSRVITQLLWVVYLKPQGKTIGVAGRLLHNFNPRDFAAVRHTSSGNVVGRVGIMGSTFRVTPAGSVRIQAVRETPPRESGPMTVSCPLTTRESETADLLERSGTTYKSDGSHLYCLTGWPDRDSLQYKVVQVDVTALMLGAEVVVVGEPTQGTVVVGERIELGDLRLVVSRIDERGWFDAEATLIDGCSSGGAR